MPSPAARRQPTPPPLPPSSAPPPPARPICPWPWRRACRSRSWSPTPARSTAAWISAPPSPMRPRAQQCRITCWTWSIPMRRSRWPTGSRRHGAWCRRSGIAAGCRCWSGGPACTSAPWSMAMSWALRHRHRRCVVQLAAELEQVGLAPLAERLAPLDPAAAARTDLRNPRRVLRALERAIQAGAPLTSRRRTVAGQAGADRRRPAARRAGSRASRRGRPMAVRGGLLDEAARPAQSGLRPGAARR